jgi:hypothetical protein
MKIYGNDPGGQIAEHDKKGHDTVVGRRQEPGVNGQNNDRDNNGKRR